TRLEACNTQLQDLADRMAGQEQQFLDAETAYNAANRQYNDYNINVTRQQSKVAALKQELEFRQNQLTDLKLQIDSNTVQLGEAARQITESQEQLKEAEALLVTLLQNKEAEERKLNEADQLYYNLRNALSEKESLLRHKQREKEQADQLLNEIKDRLNDLKLQLSGTKERLLVEFKVNLEEVMDEPRTGEDSQEELQTRVDRMKKRLENLGEVNPTAIEAFEEMRKRYEFIVEQKNDLVSAKESLLQTIQEVEATANQRFLETFNQVRENFQKVFKALFTEEDTADMVLENPENLAETGIDIVAKPKGKRPSSITQLSGGEKTLTATAMLFAIYLIKPAPFCILDEVDAPLDDANVGKFTNMIRQFSENSQFIIVTHNKMTMSAVDVIYGVTMQEAGVSKLVPVDFRNLN
ncbi:MAG TPA: AAA family ATPase, partial [Lacibacter sp.]|nr:AAA family ATPase [Lacibacter sp.]